MPMCHVRQSILDVDVDYICHQVNCQGRMGSGVAKAIKDKYPRVYENYMAKFKNVDKSFYHFFLGDIQFVPLYDDFEAEEKHPQVINMFSQLNYGYDGRKYTDYEAFWQCLTQIRDMIPKGSKIAFPYKIGCGLGGGNWHVIRTMIHEVLAKDFEVYICKLEDL